MGPLKLATYNCKNFDGILTYKYCKEIMENVDFLLLQEHWLYEQNFHKFEKINNSIDICIEGKSEMNPEVMRSGRPHGGCAILWNSTIGFNILPIKTVSKT